MPAPVVSVVVTCFNYGQFLGECMDSVLAQSCRDLELIVVDDGSTDDTARVARSREADSRVRYVRQENGGQASAKNTGIRHARTGLVAFLDADDRWLPTKLERQLPLFESSRVGVAFSRSRDIDENGQPCPQEPCSRFLEPRAGNVLHFLIFDNFVPFSSSVVRTDLLREHDGFDETLSMAIDWDLWLRLAVCCEFAFVDEPLLQYRIGHAQQMSRNQERRQACCDQINRKFLEQHPGAVPSSVLRRARAYTLASRARYFESHRRSTSLAYYTRSLLAQPLQTLAYKGLVRLLLRAGK